MATQQLASEPASEPLVLLKGWQKNMAKSTRLLLGQDQTPSEGTRNSLQQAVHARRVLPVAIDGNPQVRVILIISQNMPDAVMKADVRSHGLQAAYSIPQLRTGISLSKSGHTRRKSKRIKGREIKTYSLNLLESRRNWFFESRLTSKQQKALNSW